MTPELLAPIESLIAINKFIDLQHVYSIMVIVRYGAIKTSLTAYPDNKPPPPKQKNSGGGLLFWFWGHASNQPLTDRSWWNLTAWGGEWEHPPAHTHTHTVCDVNLYK